MCTSIRKICAYNERTRACASSLGFFRRVVGRVLRRRHDRRGRTVLLLRRRCSGKTGCSYIKYYVRRLARQRSDDDDDRIFPETELRAKFPGRLGGVHVGGGEEWTGLEYFIGSRLLEFRIDRRRNGQLDDTRRWWLAYNTFPLSMILHDAFRSTIARTDSFPRTRK